MAFSIYDDPSLLARQVEEELRESAPKSAARNLLILIVSLALFVMVLTPGTGIIGVVVLVVVVFIHEMGHLIAMRLFGYRDIQMFFIPFFGAAVSGVETSPNGTKRALVALAGPLPGIILGLICTIALHATRQPIFMTAARDFLFINTFNLLPFVPLDGGRYLEAVLFSRHPMLRAVSDGVAAIALGYLAILLKAPLLIVLAVFQLLAVKRTYASGRLAQRIKQELDTRTIADTEPVESRATVERIPWPYVERLTPIVATHVPEAQQSDPKAIAVALRRVWNLVWFKPPSAAASIGLLALFAICVVGGVIVTIGAELSFQPPATRP